jgi:hypothetical protein
VDFRNFFFFAVLLTLLMISFVSYVYAVQMTAILIPTLDSADPALTGIRFITLKYDPGSALSNQFNGKNERVEFTMNGTGGGMSELISTINQDIANQKKSPVNIVNASLSYSADLRGEPDRLSLSYKVVLNPTITKFVLEKGQQGTVLDLDWRGVIINQPLVLDTEKYGKISVNYPIGLFQATHPDLAQKFLNSEAAGIMKEPLFNFADIGIPMDRWHFLFDPTGSQASAAGYTEQSGARAVSVYSLGESSFREGTLTEKVSDATATIDGTKVSIHSSTPPPSGQIQIAGFSRIQKSGSNELAFVSAQAPEGTVTATGGFPLQVLLVLGGMMGAVAIFVLLKARK